MEISFSKIDRKFIGHLKGGREREREREIEKERDREREREIKRER